MNEPDNRLTALEDEAHAWVRLLISGNATAEDGEALKRWCNLSAANAAAFSAASQFWDAFGPAGRELLADEGRAAANPQALIRKPSMIGRRAVIGGALAASTAGVLLVRPPLGLWPSLAELRADYRTGAGEQRRIAVDGGVTVQMNSRTSLSVARSGEEAVIELIAGEAAFGPASARQPGPYSVLAAGGRTSGTGARFHLRLLAGGASVTCLSDEVEIAFQEQTTTLGARQRLTYGAGGLGRAVAIDPETASAWQRGTIVFNMTPLDQAIEELFTS
jgi:transmembrane sensor